MCERETNLGCDAAERGDGLPQRASVGVETYVRRFLWSQTEGGQPVHAGGENKHTQQLQQHVVGGGVSTRVCVCIYFSMQQVSWLFRSLLLFELCS